jgi:polyisoprenoid-binding protein YceI
MTTLKRFALAAVAAALVAAPSAFAAEVYDIDAAHAAIDFKISHLGFSRTSGAFPGLSGTITLDEKSPENSAVEVVVDAASVNTNNEGRDEHLRNEDFFNVAKYPQITFKSTKFKKTGDGYAVTGDLTLLGTTKSITVDVKELGSGEGFKGEFRRGFETSFKISRSDFGMDKMVGPIGDEVELHISLEAIRRDGEQKQE